MKVAGPRESPSSKRLGLRPERRPVDSRASAVLDMVREHRQSQRTNGARTRSIKRLLQLYPYRVLASVGKRGDQLPFACTHPCVVCIQVEVPFIPVTQPELIPRR